MYHHLLISAHAESIIRLLATKSGDYDLACAFDFAGVGLYDM
jgi:hypothetical protein